MVAVVLNAIGVIELSMKSAPIEYDAIYRYTPFHFKKNY